MHSSWVFFSIMPPYCYCCRVMDQHIIVCFPKSKEFKKNSGCKHRKVLYNTNMSCFLRNCKGNLWGLLLTIANFGNSLLHLPHLVLSNACLTGRKRKKSSHLFEQPYASHLPKQQIHFQSDMVMLLISAEEPVWLTICLWGCRLPESLSWLVILHSHSPFPTKDALQLRCYSASSSSHRMTQISNCSGSPSFPMVMMSLCCQGQEAMVEEKRGHRATETIIRFLCSTSSATKASPYAISGSIKDSCLEGGGHVNSFVAQIALFCFLKIGAVSAILQLNFFYRSPW